MNTLILNPGSTSLKYAIFDADGNRLVSKKIAVEHGHQPGYSKVCETSGYDTFNQVIVRVVHGGPNYHLPTKITPHVLQDLKSISHLAPLHNPPAIDVIESIQSETDTPVWAVFDTGFHHTIPEVAYTYAIPRELAEKHHIRRYGFHGISHQYVSTKMRKLAPNMNKIITCHLGGGSSLTAIKDGKSIDTSMGFTPTSGVIMRTRSGDIDPGIVLFLMDHLGMTSGQIQEMLNKQSGLMGSSHDHLGSEDLSEQARHGSAEARDELDLYIYSIVKYIGSYYAILGGLDALVFTGGVGENNAYVRKRICHHIGHLGISLDQEKNTISSDQARNISSQSSLTKTWIIPTDEEWMMWEESRKRRSS